MLLHNLISTSHSSAISLRISGDRIATISAFGEMEGDDSMSLYLDQMLVFPGLINSHDHLDFNLYPSLRNRIYTSYVDWGKDIHSENKSILDEVGKIPQELRVQWGLYKNLLCGVTTVVNHGKYLSIPNNIINVIQQKHEIHSVQFDKYWALKLNNPFTKEPAVLHIGEGTDSSSYNETNRLIKQNLIKRKLIGIHGVAMDEKQAEAFEALVWCPSSNYFLLGKTAAINKLKNKTHILFGTDSTLTADWDIWEHLRLAKKEAVMTDDELVNSITSVPARVWQIPHSGKLAAGYDADIVIAKASHNSMKSFFAITPGDIQLVICKGEIKLFDSSLKEQLNTIDLKKFSKVSIANSYKYIYGDVPTLLNTIKYHYPNAIFPIDICH